MRRTRTSRRGKWRERKRGEEMEEGEEGAGVVVVIKMGHKD